MLVGKDSWWSTVTSLPINSHAWFRIWGLSVEGPLGFVLGVRGLCRGSEFRRSGSSVPGFVRMRVEYVGHDDWILGFTSSCLLSDGDLSGSEK
jgi:hypothetical protein